MIDLDFDLWRSLKVKSDGAIGLPLYGFLLVFNSNIWPSLVCLQDLTTLKFRVLEFDLSMSLTVKSNGSVGLHIYGFLLVSNSNHMSIPYCLATIDTWKFPLYLLSFGPKFRTTHTHPLTMGRF